MFVSGVKCITRLDVSENNLDVELASVVNGVTRNRHLQSLNISKNLPKIKARDARRRKKKEMHDFYKFQTKEEKLDRLRELKDKFDVDRQKQLKL